jgi:biopolymer transport protein ExbB
MGVLVSTFRRSFMSFLLFAFLCGVVTSSLALVTPTTALAQDEGNPPADKPEGEAKEKLSTNPIVHFLVSIGIVFGGMFSAISIGMVALIIILLMDLRLSEALPPAFVDDFIGMVNKRQLRQAAELCKTDTSFLAQVLAAGMGRLKYGIEDAREAMMAMVEDVRSSKDAWISYLATIGTLGPMLGLVGTVSGMIGAFRKLGASTGAPNASDLAGEISHALVVTLVGVGVSVPAIFFYTFFKNRLTKITTKVTNLSDDLLTQMYHNMKAGGASAASVSTPAVAATGVQTKA